MLPGCGHRHFVHKLKTFYIHGSERAGASSLSPCVALACRRMPPWPSQARPPSRRARSGAPEALKVRDVVLLALPLVATPLLLRRALPLGLALLDLRVAEQDLRQHAHAVRITQTVRCGQTCVHHTRAHTRTHAAGCPSLRPGYGTVRRRTRWRQRAWKSHVELGAGVLEARGRLRARRAAMRRQQPAGVTHGANLADHVNQLVAYKRAARRSQPQSLSQRAAEDGCLGWLTTASGQGSACPALFRSSDELTTGPG